MHVYGNFFSLQEYQLKRHVQTNHSGIVYRCPFCKMTARYRHSMRRHFERQHKSLSNEWNRAGFVNELMEKTSSLATERPGGPDLCGAITSEENLNEKLAKNVEEELESNPLNGGSELNC